ncbi:MAG: AAA family ATPase, partial [Candidatus Vecturithrix sp.]|nr:AAA family ATPase [Candidatus Vecturithrix sp.]
MTSEPIKLLPYGLADFWKIQRDHLYYVDKTRFIPLLEAGARFVFFIRPRRFGKSLWLSVLENYYDLGFKDRFEETFKNTYIGQHPTEERNSYLILMFNFAMVNPDPRMINESFEDAGRSIVEDFLIRYQQFFPEKERKDILSLSKTESQLRRIFLHAARENLKIYLLIDEYDNFANTILTTAGEQAYRELTHGAGFFRYFFNLLKGATSGRTSGLERLFITGVSPITMDDVTSGFNIGENISLDQQYNELLGFCEEDVRDLLAYYKDAGKLTLNVDECLGIMRLWYDQYRFSTKTSPSVYNSDMVLYFVK